MIKKTGSPISFLRQGSLAFLMDADNAILLDQCLSNRARPVYGFYVRKEVKDH